jgi:hypothetical protein
LFVSARILLLIARDIVGPRGRKLISLALLMNFVGSFGSIDLPAGGPLFLIEYFGASRALASIMDECVEYVLFTRIRHEGHDIRNGGGLQGINISLTRRIRRPRILESNRGSSTRKHRRTRFLGLRRAIQ